MYGRTAPRAAARYIGIMGVARGHGALVDVERSEGLRHRRHAVLRSQPLNSLCPRRFKDILLRHGDGCARQHVGR
jgi:hypothetical protein